MSLDWLYNSHGVEGNPQEFFKLGQDLESKDELRAAATAYDRAYGLSPNDEAISSARQRILAQLAIVEHGITFRYIPAGAFLMGSKDGELDEQPVHAVKLNDYWLSETPLSWAKYCELMDLPAPPEGGYPTEEWEARQSKAWLKEIRNLLPKRLSGYKFWKNFIVADQRICHIYCEDETKLRSEDLVGTLATENPQHPRTYFEKPLVGAAYAVAQALCLRISTPAVQYRLPTEAEWEKAARGGLINAKYPWGNEPPTHDICDFGRFDDFSIHKMKTFAPNGYGLYAMCGSVWEWVQDRYDAQYYSESPKENPTGSRKGEEYVLRGGSWADDAEVLSVSFRMSSRDTTTPNIGIRLCRVEQKSSHLLQSWIDRFTFKR